MPTRAYNPNVGRALKKASSINSDRLHIINKAGSWVVKRDGVVRAQKRYSVKYNAVRYAIAALRDGRADQYVVHRRDGSIEQIKSRR